MLKALSHIFSFVGLEVGKYVSPAAKANRAKFVQLVKENSKQRDAAADAFRAKLAEKDTLEDSKQITSEQAIAAKSKLFDDDPLGVAAVSKGSARVIFYTGSLPPNLDLPAIDQLAFIDVLVTNRIHIAKQIDEGRGLTAGMLHTDYVVWKGMWVTAPDEMGGGSKELREGVPVQKQGDPVTLPPAVLELIDKGDFERAKAAFLDILARGDLWRQTLAEEIKEEFGGELRVPHRFIKWLNKTLMTSANFLVSTFERGYLMKERYGLTSEVAFLECKISQNLMEALVNSANPRRTAPQQIKAGGPKKKREVSDIRNIPLITLLGLGGRAKGDGEKSPSELTFPDDWTALWIFAIRTVYERSPDIYKAPESHDKFRNTILDLVRDVQKRAGHRLTLGEFVEWTGNPDLNNVFGGNQNEIMGLLREDFFQEAQAVANKTWEARLPGPNRGSVSSTPPQTRHAAG